MQTYVVTLRRMQHGRLYINANSKEDAKTIAKELCKDAFPEGTPITNEHVFSSNAWDLTDRSDVPPQPGDTIWGFTRTVIKDPITPSIHYAEATVNPATRDLQSRIRNLRERREMHHGSRGNAITHTGTDDSRNQGPASDHPTVPRA